MIAFSLFVLFFVLFASRTLGFDLSFAPGLSVKNAFLYLIFAALMINAALTRRYKLEAMSVFIPFVVYMLYAIFTWLILVFIVDFPGYSLRQSLISLKSGPIEHLLILLIFFYGISEAGEGLQLLRRIVWLIIIGNVIAVVDVLNILDLGLIMEREDGRIGGPIGSSNQYGAFLALFLPVIGALCLVEKGLMKKIAIGGLLISSLAFLMALSRGAIVGLVIGALIGAWYLRAAIPAKVLFGTGFSVMGLSVVTVAGAFLAGYGELIAMRFGQFGEGSAVASSGRTIIWSKALASMAENPISFVTGYGWAAYENSNFQFATHNTYLNFLYNTGGIGLGLFALIVINTLRVVRAGIDCAALNVRLYLTAFVFGFLALTVCLLFGELHVVWQYVWAIVGVSLRLAVLSTATNPNDGFSGTEIRGSPNLGS